ncbi:hypothetical protein LAZ67_X003733 [Cordylochernes scorpioides]|uniref:Ig-like domain-containing protein n=1 Tax=Cordylochernes scorpioides TaxID=51811 RepID=A0ABY6LWI6_9ARAC|nr:hypothetical protein LAZ67_X003733 [Cordylochernes scorpioides]
MLEEVHGDHALSESQCREMSVSGFLGGAASLPCEVDPEACGHVYYITWTKNVSNVWQRVFLYSESGGRALGDLAAPSRASFALENNTVRLRIHPLILTDETSYKCDVTYVEGKCPSLFFIRLFVLGKYK